jgi:hypothetical protein
MAYQLEGSLLEVCTCNVLCPCWVNEPPDYGTCQGLLGWHIEKGTVDGVDVSGRTIALVCHIPGKVLDGNWRVVAYVDDGATEEQQHAILSVWTGQKGGPMADLAQLVGEVSGVEKAPITFEVQGGKGTIRIGQNIEATMAPFLGATGQTTALHDTIFTTIPGSPAIASKASNYQVNLPNYGFAIDLQGHNAVQGSFRFESA